MLENNENTFNEFDFNISNIQKDMEIENMFINDEIINNMQKLDNNVITIDNLISNIVNNNRE